MLLAAGLGTRLKPITDHIPKALVDINGKTLLQLNLEKLKSFGYNEVIINLHHFPEQIMAYLSKNKNFGMTIELSHEENILNTGGGIKKASWFLKGNAPVLIHNVDILSDLNFSELLDAHNRNQALATLAVSIRHTGRQLLFDKDYQLRGWESTITGKQKFVGHETTGHNRFAFSGIQILSPAFFDLITEEGVFPIIDTYLRIAATHKILAFNHDPKNWFDVGKFDELELIKKRLK